MPSRLSPTAPIAADAILAGDPGRALLLAQELLGEPKMSNHARGLWGYFGKTTTGRELTIQATGMGGPSAALVVGTCVGAGTGGALGDLLIVREAIAQGGSAVSLGIEPKTAVAPDPGLTGRLQSELGSEGKLVAIASVDAHPAEHAAGPGVAAIDMQTAPLLARAASLQIGLAAVLIVSEGAHGEASLAKEALAELERRAGRAAAIILSG